MKELEKMFDYAETEVIGKSYEGRDMTVMKLCKTGSCGSKPAVWIDGGSTTALRPFEALFSFCILGIHAREWISPAVTTYAINQLTTNGEMYKGLQ